MGQKNIKMDPLSDFNNPVEIPKIPLTLTIAKGFLGNIPLYNILELKLGNYSWIELITIENTLIDLK